MHVKYSIILYFLARVAVKNWWARTVTSCCIYFIESCLLWNLAGAQTELSFSSHTHIGDKSWMSQHWSVCMCARVDVCICLMSLAVSLGRCRSEQVTPGWGERMKKTLKESGGLIWTALLCSGTVARPLSDKSKTHSPLHSLSLSLSGLQCMQPAKALGIEFALTAGSVTRVDHCQVAWVRLDSVRIFLTFAFFPVLKRPTSIWGGFTREGSSELNPAGASTSMCMCVFVRKRTHTLLTYVSLFDLWLLLLKINMY